ncbi:MAG: cytochrome b [Thiobacillaceae bacterium]
MLFAARYTRTAIGLHWLVAFLITLSFSVGLYMTDLKLSPEKLRIYSWHKWAGVTIFMLVLFRLVWRSTHRVPGPPDGIPVWQHRAAQAVHGLLYALMVIVPLSGWLMSSAKGFQTVFFGVVPIPDLLSKNKELGETLATVHKLLNYSMAGLVLAHAAAAIKHHHLDRDDVHVRMLPYLRRR